MNQKIQTQADFSELNGLLTQKQIRRLERQAKRQIRTNALNNQPRTQSNITHLHRSSMPPALKAQTEKQKDLIRSIIECDQTVTIGSAGTGKTYVTSCMAADMLLKGEINKIIITRPNVPSGRSLGFFPGTIDDKMGPWLKPITSVLEERIGRSFYEYLTKQQIIEIVPFEVIRGRSFNNAFVILDEAENTTIQEMKAFLTRIGSDSKVVINGDVKQKDIKDESGLQMVIDAIRKSRVLADKISLVEFSISDCVRSDIVADWLYYFDDNNL